MGMTFVAMGWRREKTRERDENGIIKAFPYKTLHWKQSDAKYLCTSSEYDDRAVSSIKYVRPFTQLSYSESLTATTTTQPLIIG